MDHPYICPTMKFGKVPDTNGIDFSLPPIDPRSLPVLTNHQQDEFQVYIGCPVWGMKSWIGKIYPPKAKTGDFLKYYSQSFNTIELNSTHYGLPKKATISKWYELSQADFQFCPKIPQSISHYRKLANCQTEIDRFADTVGGFQEKMGCSFMQMHPTFGPNLIGNLANFLPQWPKYIPLSIEFRHPGWFEDGQLIPQVFDLLVEHQIGAVITDVAGRRDVSHTSLTNGDAVVRFVGNQLIPSDYSRAQAWVERIAVWKKMGLNRLFMFVHEPDDTFAPEMGAYFIELLNDQLGTKLKTPGVPENSDSQMKLF